MLIENNSIQSKFVCLTDFFKNKQIGIPIFQRFFDWKPEQAEEILKDILSSIEDKDKMIYLLDFIYYEEDGKIKLADGQQRIVSINSLIKAINDVIDERELSINKVSQFNISYDILANDKKYSQSFNNYPVSPFKKIYLYLKQFVVDNIDKIEDIINVIETKFYIYVKKCSSADDAFLVFQQINTGGKPLSKDEIIKTSLDQYSQVYNVPIEATVKELKQMVSSYYKFLMPETTANFDNIAIMSFLKEKVVKTRESFTNFVRALETVADTENSAIASVIKYINRSQLLDILNVMSMKGINIEVQKDYLTKIMAPLCLLSISMSMKKSNPGGIIRTLYASVISMLKYGNSVDEIAQYIASFINDNAEICKITFSNFTAALGDKTLSQGIKKAILILDVILRNTSSTIIIDNINLEHIYPQKPHGDWSYHGWPTDRDEQMDLIQNIGNYLLLNEEVNKTIKNKYIIEKISHYERIIPNDLSLKTDMNKVDFGKFERDRKNYIFERQRIIAGLVKQNFPFGTTIITD